MYARPRSHRSRAQTARAKARATRLVACLLVYSAPVSTLSGLARHLGAASLAGIVAGIVVGGLLGRVAMRIAGFTSRPELAGTLTSNGNRVGEITFPGTMAIVVFVGIVGGIGGGVLYASAEPWLRSRRWKGLLFGIALFVALGFSVVDPSNVDFKRFGVTALNVALFAALFIAFGVVVAWIFERIRRTIDGTGAAARGLEIVAWSAAIGAGALAAISFVSFGGLDDPVAAALFAAAVLIPAVVRWRRLPRAVAYAAFAVPIAAGGARTLAGLRDLLP